MRKSFLFLVLFLPILVFGQQYQFLEYSVPEGLAQSQVTSIVQDQKGYLWIGTQGGLSKFDGIEFKSFSTNDGLVGNSITKICFDKKNRLWIAANGGVSLLNENGEFENYAFSDKFSGTSASDLIYYKGKLFISTNGSGLFYLNENKIEQYPNQEGLNPKIRSLFLYKNKLLLGTKKGVRYLDHDEFKSFHNELDSISISSFDKKNDSLIIGTYGAGAALFYENKLQFLQYSISGFNRVRKVYIGKDGEVWTSSKYGVLKYHNNQIISFTEAEGLPTRNVYCIFSDSENNIWFGTSGNGLQKLASLSFLSYSDKSGMLSNKVMAISKDYKNNYWFGTIDRGLSLYDGNSFNNFEGEKTVDKRTIRAFVSESDRLLIGTSNGIVSMRYDENNEPHFYRDPEFDDLRYNRITIIHSFEKGKYWIANMDEIWVVNSDSSYLLSPEEYGYSGFFRDIKKTKEGQIYVATTSGLFKYTNNRFNTIELKNNENNQVNCIAFDPDGNMVLGTSNGLFFDKGNRFVRVDLGFQFNENILNFIEFDGDGNLYAGTNNGLFVIKRSSVGYEHEKPFKYSMAHGLNSVETNLGSSFVDDNKTVWFGTIGGVVRQKENALLFEPEETPKIQLLDIMLFFESKNWKNAGFELDKNRLPKNLELGYKENHVTFNFIGLFFKDPNNVVYQYRLKGVNDEWSPNRKQSNVTFPELSYGDYTFEVRAKYSDGPWSSIESYSFKINAPYYKKFWFYLIIAALIMVLVFAFFQYRLTVFKRNKETEKLVLQGKLLSLEQRSLNASMNRHFIFNSLNSIQYFINMKDRVSANKYLTNFAKLIRKNLDSSTASDNLVTLEDEIERLKLYLSLEMMRFQGKFEYEFIVSETLDKELVKIPSMMLQPFIENSIIHGILPKKGNDGLIEIRIEEEGADYMVIEIIDNGIGIDQSRLQKQSSQGDHISQGMKITQSRIEIIKNLTNRKLMLVGPKQINNKDGSIYGTHVLIKIPT